MRIVFLGSPAPAAGALRRLLDAGYDVAAVYTQPNKPAGRSAEPVPTPVKRAALELGIEVRSPQSWRAASEVQALADLQAEVFVVVAYGRILPPPVLAAPPLGILNVHPSLLPKRRGPSPVASAIAEGDSYTGVTIMLLDQGMDSGPILGQSAPVKIGERDTCGSLTDRLFEIGVEMLVEVLPRYAAGEISPHPQDEGKATFTRLLKRSDGEIDWALAATRIERMVRAYDPWPGTHTRWNGRVLKVVAAALAEGIDRPPGQVALIGERLVVSAGEGALDLRRVQLEGRRTVTGPEFARGNPRIDGAALPS